MSQYNRNLIVNIIYCVAIYSLMILCSRPVFGGEEFDSEAIEKIIEEGNERSQVMDHLYHITEGHGPRLTGSPGYMKAARWAVERFSEMELENSHLESAGLFGNGWELEHHSLHVTEPYVFPVISFPKAWSPGTGGRVRGEAVYFDADTDSALQTYDGKLSGKFVLLNEERNIVLPFGAEATRRSDENLLDLANAPQPAERVRRRRRTLTAEQKQRRIISYQKQLMAKEEGAIALLTVGRGNAGNIFVQQASVPSHPDTPRVQRPRAWTTDPSEILPQIAVTAEHYNLILRMLEHGQEVNLEMDLRVEFYDEDSVYNVIAELPGSDLSDQVVMIGAHYDSWQGSTGTTDNAAGSAICMEAMRILKATGLQPRRTIRVALWGGEEQGLYGSEGYVKSHFGEMIGPDSNRVTKYQLEAEKFTAYYNLDNGAGKIRGIYLQGNAALSPIFREWLRPFNEMGASTVSLQRTRSTDHVAFEEIGLPGFQFIQDRLEYRSRTHHSTMDHYDRAIEDDLKQAATIMAAFAYNTAMRDERLPRKPRKNVMLDWAPEIYGSPK